MKHQGYSPPGKLDELGLKLKQAEDEGRKAAQAELFDYSLDELDAQLLDERRVASTTWPYTGTNDRIRVIEAEYARRDEKLPENRA